MCASGASIRVEWMLRSHDVAYSLVEEIRIKERHPNESIRQDSKRLLLFLTIHEALAYCETGIIHRMGKQGSGFLEDRFSPKFSNKQNGTLAFVFSRILGCASEEERTLQKLNSKRYHEEIEFDAGEEIFAVNTHSDAFFIVLHGSVAVAINTTDHRYAEKSAKRILSGAGVVEHSISMQDLLDPYPNEKKKSPFVFASVWPVGGVFGYVDCL